MSTSSKIVLITSGQPSVNPRLVKEADALAEAGYEVTVFYQYWNSWATTLDEQLLKQKKWLAIRVGGNPTEEKTKYWITRVAFKIGNITAKALGFDLGRAELALGRCTSDLKQAAKQIQADLYIAHNLAALPAAISAAKKYHSKCGFDAEDFHRNEVSNNTQDFDVRLKTYIENKYFQKLDYLTTASPLISDAYTALYPSLKAQTLLNVFPNQYTIKNKATGNPLKLFWFSQTIGTNRGLEQIFEALGQLHSYPIELHLLGKYEHAIKRNFEEMADKNKVPLFFHQPILADEIYNFAAQFDVGLATEIGMPKNRDLCLTNKIFTYIQAGMAILASATAAQEKIMKDFPGMGIVYQQNQLTSLVEAIKTLATDPRILEQYKEKAKLYAEQQLNWEIEKEKFLAIVAKTLNKA